jgi:hypothetical protein
MIRNKLTKKIKNVKVTKKIKSEVKKDKAIHKPYKKLTKEEYARALQHPKWQKKRLKVFERDNWQCVECGDTETTLHVHHLKYTTKFPWNEKSINLITLCNSCHAKAHRLLKR